MNRRSLLVGAAAAAVAAEVSSTATAASAAPPPKRKKRVVVIGAGLAGLAAAHEIQKVNRSVEIVLLEARPRVGGRVLTIRRDQLTGEPFDEGQYVEVGAHRIPETHDRTLGYVDELGLSPSVVEFSHAMGGGASGQQKYVLKGTSFFFDGVAWPSFLNLSAAERAKSVFQQSLEYEFKYVTGPRPPKGSNSLGHPAVPLYKPANWPYGDGIRSTLDQWNALTLAEFHTQNGASDDWRRLYMADNGTEVLRLAALAWLAQSALDFDWGTTYYLDGGLDQIPGRLATSVQGGGASILLEHKVTSLVRTLTGIDVNYRDALGTARTLVADEVVCTAPFPVLRTKVDLSAAGIAADKMFWINSLGMTPAARVALQVKDRFWRDEGIEGLKLAGTDTPMERVWHSTNTQPGNRGILQVYLQGQNALDAPVAGTLPWVRDGLSPLIFPQIADSSQGWNGKGVAKLWHQDEWAGGAWAAPKPNEMLQGFHTWGRAEGRVHFAGEHTSLYAGWMQGAIESGQRAAAEVAAAL